MLSRSNSEVVEGDLEDEINHETVVFVSLEIQDTWYK